MPSVSVIIPVFNDAERLRLCLAALAAQTLPQDAFEVIVVDNGSDEPPRELVEGYPFARFAEEAKPGSYPARNLGLTLARADTLAFTDADCIPEPGWLERLVDGLDAAGPGCGSVGGRVDIFPRDDHRPSGVELYDCIWGMPQESCVRDSHFAVTASMATRREVFDQVGPFNGKLKSGGDVEWGQRLAAHGLSVAYVSDAVVRHPARSRLRQIINQGRRHTGGRFDMKEGRRYNYFSLHYLWVASRLLFPSLEDVRRIARHPRITNPWRWLRAMSVLLAVRYAYIFEHFRLALGGRSVRE